MAQSQYATTTQVQQLAITPALYTRFENAVPGCTTAALQASSSLLDSFLAGQFVMPLVSWDMSLTLATCVIAAKLLYDQFGYNPAAPVDALIQRRYDETLSWAAQVRDKKIQPQWIDSSGIVGTDQAGDFVVSDKPVGFTGRGAPTSVVPSPPTDPWDGGL